jgi:hypothetical protein
MQTFLPSPSFKESASILDQRRLGKQRVETLQIMSALIDGRGWINHPAVRMWRGYEYSLLNYQLAICTEWHIYRGFEDTCLRKTMDIFWTRPWLALDYSDPYWLDDDDFHRAHQSNLLKKDQEFYGPMFDQDLPNDLEYLWPEGYSRG